MDSPSSEPAFSVRSLRAIGRGLLMQPRLLSWILPMAWGAAIFLLSSLSGSERSPQAWELGGLTGNLAHPAIFGVLALLLVPLAPRRGKGAARWTALSSTGALWIIAAVGLYGFTDELHQSTVAGRDASVFDLLSDMVGAAAVVAIVMYLGRSDAEGPGLRRRLLRGFALSLAAAGLATLWGILDRPSPWPF